jgi:hypothetical protein
MKGSLASGSALACGPPASRESTRLRHPPAERQLDHVELGPTGFSVGG